MNPVLKAAHANGWDVEDYDAMAFTVTRGLETVFVKFKNNRITEASHTQHGHLGPRDKDKRKTVLGWLV